MLATEPDFTIITFNTIIDACARCEELHRIPTFLKDMDRLMIQPNTITYGAILKGYCQEGNLHKAHELLRSMKDAAGFGPDEIMYNFLLDRCARQGLWERANAVLKQNRSWYQSKPLPGIEGHCRGQEDLPGDNFRCSGTDVLFLAVVHELPRGSQAR